MQEYTRQYSTHTIFLVEYISPDWSQGEMMVPVLRKPREWFWLNNSLRIPLTREQNSSSLGSINCFVSFF